MKLLQSNKVLLDAAHAHKAVKDRNAASLIVCSARPATAKWLLAHNRPGAFFVVVYVASCVTKFVGCLDQSLALRGEARIYKEIRCDTKRGNALDTHMAPVRAYSDVVLMRSSV